MGPFFENLWQGLRGWLASHRGGLTRIATIAGAVILVPVALVFALPVILGWFAQPLDSTKDLYGANRPIAFTFLDADGNDVGHRGAIVGERLTLEQLPPYLPAAFIAMEDRRFYSHSGIDPRGLLRALLADLRARHWVAGGSTITQQTAKIVFTNQERTFSRKLSEFMDAMSLEKSLSKKQILELYLNRIYLGSGAYGVDGAAHVYFGKSAKDLSLSEAAMLATLTSAPSVFSPRRDLDAAQDRTKLVLKAMVEIGAITQGQADDAAAHPAEIADRASIDARNYYLDAASDEALKDIDRASGGTAPTTDLVVHTMLEPKIQEAARAGSAKILRTRGVKMHASQAAVVVMTTDGGIAAMVGGVSYDDSTFNRATQGHRQPGSAFKPFVYLSALENGISPWDVRDDGPVDIGGWTPTNYGGRVYGTVTLADALAHSINTITASLGQEVGISNVVDAAHRCGIVSDLEANASLALGTSEVTPLELTRAYAAFASGGIKVYPYMVTEVDDRQGHVLFKRKPPPPERVIASHVDRDLVEMMYGVMTSGTGAGAQIPGHDAAGKTGTTQDYHDAWFVGFTADYVAGVWVGNDDSSPMKTVTGASLPAAIWKIVMTKAEAGLPSRPLDKSEPQAPVDATGTLFMGSGEDTMSAAPTDDEAAPTPSEQDQRQSGGFFDWLFGHPKPPKAPPAVPPGQTPSQNNDDDDN
jgi:penicillin-binding protein 1A